MGIVNYLLDTHTFLWAVRGSVKLSYTALKALEDANAIKYISAASAYEIINKFRIGKLSEFKDVANDYFSHVKLLGAIELPIKENHAHYAGGFEWEHRDPFDRLLAAQAFIEKLTLITNDPAFQTLPWISVLW